MAKTYRELKNEGWNRAPAAITNIVKAMLVLLETEMTRGYWNKYQKEFDNPFENSGADSIQTKAFTVRSYDWSVEDMNQQLPNFETEEMKVFWYKQSNRDVTILVKEDVVAKLPEMLNTCVKAVEELYKEV